MHSLLVVGEKKKRYIFKNVTEIMSVWQEQKICQRYDQLMEAWEKKVERMENNPRRKAKESRTREYYERQFPEIRKQREQQERFQRSAQHHYPCPEFPTFPERFPSRKFQNRLACKLVLRTRASLRRLRIHTNTHGFRPP